jgi:hypothetical protein
VKNKVVALAILITSIIVLWNCEEHCYQDGECVNCQRTWKLDSLQIDTTMYTDINDFVAIRFKSDSILISNTSILFDNDTTILDSLVYGIWYPEFRCLPLFESTPYLYALNIYDEYDNYYYWKYSPLINGMILRQDNIRYFWGYSDSSLVE